MSIFSFAIQAVTKTFGQFVKINLFLYSIVITLSNCNSGSHQSNVDSHSEFPLVITEASGDTNQTVTGQAITTSVSGLTYKIISSDDNTFGYDIYREQKLLIHQPAMPSLPGNKGFETKVLAEAVAQLVLQKISNGEMPPTITNEELSKMGVKIK